VGGFSPPAAVDGEDGWQWPGHTAAALQHDKNQQQSFYGGGGVPRGGGESRGLDKGRKVGEFELLSFEALRAVSPQAPFPRMIFPSDLHPSPIPSLKTNAS